MSDVLKQQKFDFIITVRYSYEFYDKEMMAGLSWPFSDYLIYLLKKKSSVLKFYSWNKWNVSLLDNYSVQPNKLFKKIFLVNFVDHQASSLYYLIRYRLFYFYDLIFKYSNVTVFRWYFDIQIGNEINYNYIKAQYIVIRMLSILCT